MRDFLKVYFKILFVIVVVSIFMALIGGSIWDAGSTLFGWPWIAPWAIFLGTIGILWAAIMIKVIWVLGRGLGDGLCQAIDHWLL